MKKFLAWFFKPPGLLARPSEADWLAEIQRRAEVARRHNEMVAEENRLEAYAQAVKDERKSSPPE